MLRMEIIVNVLSLPLPMMLSLFFPLLLCLVSITGAGSEGLPEPRFALASSVAAVTDAWDCWITLNSLTT